MYVIYHSIPYIFNKSVLRARRLRFLREREREREREKEKEIEREKERELTSSLLNSDKLSIFCGFFLKIQTEH